MKKGFTLIEILAVIVLLGILLTLASISVVDLRRNSEKKLYTEKIKYIETGASKWGKDNLNDLNSSCHYISVSDLIANEYITGDSDDKSKLLMPGTDGDFNAKCVCVKYENVYSGKNLAQYSNYQGTTKYEVTASYGEGKCH